MLSETLPDAAVILRDQTEDHLLHWVNYTAAQADISKSGSKLEVVAGWLAQSANDTKSAQFCLS